MSQGTCRSTFLIYAIMLKSIYSWQIYLNVCKRSSESKLPSVFLQTEVENLYIQEQALDRSIRLVAFGGSKI